MGCNFSKTINQLAPVDLVNLRADTYQHDDVEGIFEVISIFLGDHLLVHQTARRFRLLVAKIPCSRDSVRMISINGLKLFNFKLS